MNSSNPCRTLLVSTLAFGLAPIAASLFSVEPGWAVSKQNGMKLAIQPPLDVATPADAIVEYALTNESGSKLIWRRVAGDDGTSAHLVAPDGKALATKEQSKGGPKYSKTSVQLEDGKTWFGNVPLSKYFDFTLPGVYRGNFVLTLYKNETIGTQSAVEIKSLDFEIEVRGLDAAADVAQESPPLESPEGSSRLKAMPEPSTQMPSVIAHTQAGQNKPGAARSIASDSSWIWLGAIVAVSGIIGTWRHLRKRGQIRQEKDHTPLI